MVLVLAHRGLHTPTPPDSPASADSQASPEPARRENTVAAFAAAASARSAGVDGVELDVRMTVDGGLLVHHDAEIPGLGPVSRLDFDRRPAWVPSLDAALDACEGLTLINVEIKADGSGPAAIARAVADALSRWSRLPPERTRSALLVSSFSREVIDAHLVAAPEIPTGWLTADPGLLDAERMTAEIDGLAAAGHRSVHPHQFLVTGSFTSCAHAAGLTVAVWTVDDVDAARGLVRAGVNVIVSNHPVNIATALANPPP